MGFARAANVPVVLLGDIDRGGVIASLVGTKAVIDPADAAMIVGFIVNRFRGDPSLFDDGMKTVSERTGWPALGLVPYFEVAYRLPPEDAVVLQDHRIGSPDGRVRIAVLVYPRIANFDDFDPLRVDPIVDLVFVGPHQPVPGDAALVILPGSKATIADLASLREFGWDIDLRAHVRRGGAVLGICGGYQMLGRTVADPHGIEGPPATVEGLGLLDVETVLEGDKILVEVRGETAADGVPFKGYEMHVGRTTGNVTPLLKLQDGKAEGAISPDGRIAGCYIHGLLTDDRQRRHWLQRIGAQASTFAYESQVDTTLDLLADHLEKHVDCDRLLALARAPKLRS
jgi:adenosylcobyric acid synthase